MLRPSFIDILTNTLRHVEATTEISHDDPVYIDFKKRLLRLIADLELEKIPQADLELAEAPQSDSKHKPLTS